MPRAAVLEVVLILALSATACDGHGSDADAERTPATASSEFRVVSGELERRRVGLGGGPAVRARFQVRTQSADGIATEVTGVQYYVPTPAAVFVVALASAGGSAYAPRF